MAKNIDEVSCPIEHFSNVDMVVRKDILDKTKELAELITTSAEVELFQQAEKKVEMNETIQTLIKAIKKKQKEAVAFQSFQNQEMVKKIEAEIEELQDQLDGIPIVSEFKQSQQDINYLLQLVMNVIKDIVAEKVNVESGKAESGSTCSD